MREPTVVRWPGRIPAGKSNNELMTTMDLLPTFAKLAGAYPVIAIDLNNFRLQKAKDRGIDICLNPSETDNLTETVRSHCVTDGVDLLIEATGIPAVYPIALQGVA